ncbi:MAG: HutD family protein [Firmicutes bacterium]|nr:HutD family protein [Bacillota bacterium]
MKVIRGEEQAVHEWGGGQTRELAIGPEGATYAKRDFAWRLSTATITSSPSSFTPLKGYRRVTVVTRGAITLIHEGHHRAHLTPYLSDTYSGDWQTQSSGVGEDFNVMVAAGIDEVVQIIWVSEGAEPLCVRRDGDIVALYVPQGEVLVSSESSEYQVFGGDLALLTSPSKGSGEMAITWSNGAPELAVILVQLHCKEQAS